MKKDKPVFEGWYEYENILNQDLILPYDTKWGRIVKPHGKFEGDSRFSGLAGVHCTADMSYKIAPRVTEAVTPTIPEAVPEPQLLVEAPTGQPLEFFEADGTALNKPEKAEAVGIDMVTKKELVEFAKLKGLKINAFTSKENILRQIRETKHED